MSTPVGKPTAPQGHAVSLRSTGGIPAQCSLNISHGSAAALMRLINLLGIILAFVLEISYYIYCFYQKSTE